MKINYFLFLKKKQKKQFLPRHLLQKKIEKKIKIIYFLVIVLFWKKINNHFLFF